jgi:uncharacterized protein (TIGR02147 family)
VEGFRPDPVWIRKRLKHGVSRKEVQEALQFLLQNGYLEAHKDGTVTIPQKEILCVGGVYRIALAHFHREMLQLAIRSLDHLPVEERDMTGYTVAIPKSRFGALKKLCYDFLRQVSELEKSGGPADSVYHVALAAFPLVEPSKKEAL